MSGHDPVDEPPGGLDRPARRAYAAPRAADRPAAAGQGRRVHRRHARVGAGRAAADGAPDARTEGRSSPRSCTRSTCGAAGRVGGPLRFPGGGSRGLMSAGNRVFITNPGEDATWEIDPAAMRVVRRHPAGGTFVAVQPDGAGIALGSEDGGVRLLDLRTGEVQALAGRHRAEVAHIVFTPDGGTLVSSGADGSLLVVGRRAAAGARAPRGARRGRRRARRGAGRPDARQRRLRRPGVPVGAGGRGPADPADPARRASSRSTIRRRAAARSATTGGRSPSPAPTAPST